MNANPLPGGQTPLARNTDPETSHQSARITQDNGDRKHQQNLVVSAVTQYPGLTGAELAREVKMDRYMIGRRQCDCRRAGTIVQGKARQCEVTGRKAHTYYPAGAK